MFGRLRDEFGFAIEYTTGKDYLREPRRLTSEIFVQLFHPQRDPGEARVVISSMEQKAQQFFLDLLHSEGRFVKAHYEDSTGSSPDGHVSTFVGGMHQSILVDNIRLAVAKIMGDGRRQRTRSLTQVQSHYC